MHALWKGRRNSAFAIAIAAIAALVAAGCGSSPNSASGTAQGGANATSPASLTTIRQLVQPGNFEDLPLYVAQETGIAAKNGINLNFIVSTQPLTPLASGAADMSAITGTLAIEALSQGYPVTVAGVVLAGNPQPLMVPASANIPINQWPATFRALAGKTIGTSVIGGGLDNIMKYAMTLAGVDPKTGFTDLAVGTSAAMQAAIQGNRIFAAFAPPPFAQIWPSIGLTKVAYDFTTAKGPAALNAPSNLDVVSQSFASKYPGVVRNFMEMVVQAETYMENPANMSQVTSIGISKILPGQKSTIVQQATQSLYPLLNKPCFTAQDFNEAYGQAKALNLLKKPVTYGQLLDTAGQLTSC
jgi:ABC-type nitrate/sulfonate/bicarbonate transport system substrate-binding protein